MSNACQRTPAGKKVVKDFIIFVVIQTTDARLDFKNSFLLGDLRCNSESRTLYLTSLENSQNAGDDGRDYETPHLKAKEIGQVTEDEPRFFIAYKHDKKQRNT